jgi:linoleate 10R-lipoxygenase
MRNGQKTSLYLELFRKPSAEVSIRYLLIGLKKWEASIDKNPHKRPFAHLHRGEDGKFSDDELVHIMA